MINFDNHGDDDDTGGDDDDDTGGDDDDDTGGDDDDDTGDDDDDDTGGDDDDDTGGDEDDATGTRFFRIPKMLNPLALTSLPHCNEILHEQFFQIVIKLYLKLETIISDLVDSVYQAR